MKSAQEKHARGASGTVARGATKASLAVESSTELRRFVVHESLLLFMVCLMMSGGSALIYQVAWTREFRLVFGGTTAAAASVLAVLMGGMGSETRWRRVGRIMFAIHLKDTFFASLCCCYGQG